MLLERARGDRTQKKFASDCGISYVQLHKLEMCAQENPPGLKLLTKLAENSEGGIELEDYLFVCGISEDEKKNTKKQSKSLDIQGMYNNLSQGQKKTVYDFMDYLLTLTPYIIVFRLLKQIIVKSPILSHGVIL